MQGISVKKIEKTNSPQEHFMKRFDVISDKNNDLLMDIEILCDVLN